MEHCEKALVYVLALEQFLKTSVLLDSTVLAYAEKKNAVDGPLHGYIELINGEGGIPDSDVFCKNIPPLFDLGKNGFINGGGPFLAFSSFDKFIKRTPQDTFLRKDGFDPTPLLRILLESEIRDSGSCSNILRSRNSVAPFILSRSTVRWDAIAVYRYAAPERMCSSAAIRARWLSFFESLTEDIRPSAGRAIVSGEKITSPRQRGPARAPLPTSSTPAIRRYP